MKPAHCRTSWILSLLLLTPPLLAAQTPQAERPEFERADGGTLFFKNQKPLKTALKEVKYLGFLNSAEGSPYFVVSGRNCVDCLEDRAIFLVRQDGGKPHQFVQPGKILDPKTRAPLMESRAFFGQCLAGARDAYVVFQRELIEKKHHGRRRKSIEPSIFVAEPTQVGLDEKLTELRSVGALAARQSHALAQVKKKQCFEIESRSRLMLSKPLDLKARRDGDDAEDEDEAHATPAASDEEPPAAPGG